MKLIIIFFLSFSILAVYCEANEARKVEGQIIIYEVDEKGNESSLDEEMWPNFCVDLYYRDETGKEFPCKCTDSPNISDKLRFVITISAKCNSSEFYDKKKELYLKPNFGSKGTPAGWDVDEPPPHIMLDKNQGDEPYPPNKNLVIRIPKIPKPEDKQANLKKAEEEVKQNPGNSITYLWAASRVEGEEHKFAKKAYYFLRKNDQELYANRHFRNQYLEKQKKHIHTPTPRDGGIYGSVVLGDGSKVPGVLVTITGNQIGRLTTISSEKGNFRFLGIPPGEYTIRGELEGFKTVIRKEVEVGLGKTVTLEILMETVTLEEDINIID